MKPDREYADYLEDILYAIEKALSFVSGINYEQFSK